MPAPKIHEVIDLEVFGETFPEGYQVLCANCNIYKYSQSFHHEGEIID